MSTAEKFLQRCEICRNDHATVEHYETVRAHKLARKKRERERRRSNPEEVEKERARKRASYKRHAEKTLARAKARRAALVSSDTHRCQVCSHAHATLDHGTWLADMREARLNRARSKAAGRSKEQREASNAMARARRAKFKAEHPELHKEANRKKEIYARDSGYRKVARARRRARLRGGKLSGGIVKVLFALQRGRCPYCASKLAGSKAHLDHIIPLAVGGLNVDANVQLLCADCNQSKGSKMPEVFAKQRGFLI